MGRAVHLLFLQLCSFSTYGLHHTFEPRTLSYCEHRALSLGTTLADYFNSYDEATTKKNRAHSDYILEHLGFGLEKTKGESESVTLRKQELRQRGGWAGLGKISSSSYWALEDKWVYMMGDSTQRQVWATFSAVFQDPEFEKGVKLWTRENCVPQRTHRKEHPAGGKFPEEGWEGTCGSNEVTCTFAGFGNRGLLSFDWKHFPWEDYDEWLFGDQGKWRAPEALVHNNVTLESAPSPVPVPVPLPSSLSAERSPRAHRSRSTRAVGAAPAAVRGLRAAEQRQWREGGQPSQEHEPHTPHQQQQQSEHRQLRDPNKKQQEHKLHHAQQKQDRKQDQHPQQDHKQQQQDRSNKQRPPKKGLRAEPTDRAPDVLTIQMGLHTCWHALAAKPTNKSMIARHTQDMTTLLEAVRSAVHRAEAGTLSHQTMVIVITSGRLANYNPKGEKCTRTLNRHLAREAHRLGFAVLEREEIERRLLYRSEYYRGAKTMEQELHLRRPAPNIISTALLSLISCLERAKEK